VSAGAWIPGRTQDLIVKGRGETAASQWAAEAITTTNWEWRRWSDNHIAKHWGVAVSFVVRLRGQLFPENSSEGHQRLYKRDGEVQTMDTSLDHQARLISHSRH
jgi:hypothetical protein